MTAGPPPLNVRTFDDALDQGYEVIVTGDYHWWLLKESKNGTAKHAIYKKYFEQYENDIDEYGRWWILMVVHRSCSSSCHTLLLLS